MNFDFDPDNVDPKTAVFTRSLFGFIDGVTAPFRSLGDSYSFAHTAFMGIAFVGAAFGAVGGGIAGGMLAFEALGAATAMAVTGIVAAIPVGCAAGIVAGGLAAGGLYLSVAGLLGVSFGLARGAFGLARGGIETAKYHLDKKNTPPAPAPTPAAQVTVAAPPIIDRVDQAFDNIEGLSPAEQQRLLDKLAKRFNLPNTKPKETVFTTPDIDLGTPDKDAGSQRKRAMTV